MATARFLTLMLQCAECKLSSLKLQCGIVSHDFATNMHFSAPTQLNLELIGDPNTFFAKTRMNHYQELADHLQGHYHDGK